VYPAFGSTGNFGLAAASIAQLHNTVYMKNITLSIDEDVLAAVRRHAAERNSTINAFVRDYLTNLAAHEDRANRARALSSDRNATRFRIGMQPFLRQPRLWDRTPYIQKI
jgi:hypothetical protein